LDFQLKSLATAIAGQLSGPWPVEIVDALRSRNAQSQSIDRRQLTSSTITADTRGNVKDGRAVVRVSLPAYLGDRAAVIVHLSYGAAITWAVLLERSGEGWRVIEKEQLSQS